MTTMNADIMFIKFVLLALEHMHFLKLNENLSNSETEWERREKETKFKQQQKMYSIMLCIFVIQKSF